MTTIGELEGEISKALVKETFSQTSGGFLSFVCAIGLAAIYAACLFAKPAISVWIFEATYMAICSMMGYALYRVNCSNSELRRLAIGSILEKIPFDGFNESAYGGKLAKGLKYAGEVVFMLLEFARKGGDRGSATEILNNVLHMLELQYDSAKQIEESRRILDLVSSDRSGGDDHLLENNLKSTREYIREEEDSIDELNGKLKTLTLQVSQLETQVSQRKITAANFAAETSDMIKQLQWTVDQRKTAAANVIKQLNVK